LFFLIFSGNRLTEWKEDSNEVSSNPTLKSNADPIRRINIMPDTKKMVTGESSNKVASQKPGLPKDTSTLKQNTKNIDLVKPSGASQSLLNQKKKSVITSVIKAWDLFDGNLPINASETVLAKSKLSFSPDKNTKQTNSSKTSARLPTPIEKNFISNYSYESIDVEKDDLDISYFL
jgi:hypothetical protein